MSQDTTTAESTAESNYNVSGGIDREGMRKRKAWTYASVYNELYVIHARKPRVILQYIRKLLDSRALLQIRVRRMRYLETVYTTQRIGATLSHTRICGVFKQAQRLLQIATMIQLRKIQRCVLKYLWRPNGQLVYKQFKDMEDMSFAVCHDFPRQPSSSLL